MFLTFRRPVIPSEILNRDRRDRGWSHTTRYRYAHRTLHDTTRHDTTRQLQTRKSCNVRGSTTRRDTTRQKSGLVVSDLTMLDICDKVRFLSCCVASCRRHDFLVGGCLVVSRRVMCGGHYDVGVVGGGGGCVAS